VIQQTYQLIPRSPTCLADDILDHGHHSCIVCHDDQPPLVMVNRVGLPQATLLTFLSFLLIYAFRDGGPMTIWDSHSPNMEEPNVDDGEHAMGFHIGTIVVLSIFLRSM
jgi:hypothetical protein